MKLFAANSQLPDTADTHELLRRIETKDSKFRIAQAVFFVLVIGALITILTLVYNIQNANHDLLKTQSKSLDSQEQIINQLNDNGKANTKQLDSLQQHIDCITALFQQPNRAQLTLTDITTCQFTSNGGTSTGSTPSGTTSNPKPSSPSTTTPTPTPQPPGQSKKK